MPDRVVQFTVDEQLALRAEGRAAEQGQNLGQVLRQLLTTWVGDWGQTVRTYTVQPGDTLSAIALRFYGDVTKAADIAAYNGITNPALIHVGQVLKLPDLGVTPTPTPVPQPLPKGESPYIFGFHDRGGEGLMAEAGRKGWVVCTEELGADRNNWDSRSYADLADGGYGVIVRLNHGYNEQGTLPRSERYADFALRCGNFVERSNGCHIWIIANEPNLAYERPGGPQNGEWITPAKYVSAFRACRNEIRRRPGHASDQVVTAAIGPWNIQTSYPGNPGGDWVTYLQDMLTALGSDVDGISIHTYARDADPANIVSEARMNPPYEQRRSMFRTYIDFMEAIPQALRNLPVYLTETDENMPWANTNNGWVRAAYAEINRWNSSSTRQKIRCVALYRWETYDIWAIRNKGEVINDFRGALQNDYRWRS
jgi:hypothetical protein